MAEKQKFSSYYLDQFLSITAIKGFSFIRVSSSPYEKGFWITVAVAFIYLTIMNIYESIDIYLSEPTSSRFFLMTNNSITFDSPIICAPTDFSSLNINFNERNTTELSEFLEVFALVNTTIDDLVVKYVGSSNYTNDSLDSLLYLASIAITNVARLEQAVFNSKSKLDLGFYIEYSHKAVADTQVPGQLIHNFFTKRIGNLTLVFKEVCKFLCRKMKTKAVKYEVDLELSRFSKTEGSPCDKCLWLGLFVTSGLIPVCNQFEVPDVFTVRQPFDFIYIILSPSAIVRRGAQTASLGKRKSAKWGFGTNFGKKSLEDIPIPYDKQTAISLHILGDFETVSTKKSPCGSVSHMQCYVKCQSILIVEHCNCTPLYSNAFVNALSSKQACFSANLVERISTCKGDIISAKAKQCVTDCPESCKNLLFTYNYVHLEEELFVTNETVLKVSVLKFVYPKTVEFLTMGLADLIVRFAGNLSLWLGASFIALLHICVFALKAPWEFSKYKMS